LRENGHEVKEIKTDDENFEEELRETEVLLIMTYTIVNKELLSKAPKLKYVLRQGVGLDNIDVDLCKERGIEVINSPASNAVSVAEHTVLLILACMRNLIHANRLVKKGEWKREKTTELKGKTVGILGFGAIGREVARRLRGFGVGMIAYDVYKDEETAKELGVKFVGINKLMKDSDIISIHVPLLPSTRAMINEKIIEKMKDGVIIVNTARGGIIDEKAMIAALERGKIAFAGLDVFESEPPENKELLYLENTILTPHIAGATKEAYSKMCLFAVKKFLEKTK